MTYKQQALFQTIQAALDTLIDSEMSQSKRLVMNAVSSLVLRLEETMTEQDGLGVNTSQL